MRRLRFNLNSLTLLLLVTIRLLGQLSHFKLPLLIDYFHLISSLTDVILHVTIALLSYSLIIGGVTGFDVSRREGGLL